MEEVNIILAKLVKFRCNANWTVMKKIFGGEADHMWDKFNKCESDVLMFYTCLDDENKKKLSEFISKIELKAKIM